jgi:hypothetical protein
LKGWLHYGSRILFFGCDGLPVNRPYGLRPTGIVEDGTMGLVDVDLIKSDFFLFFTHFPIIQTFQYSISRVPTDRLKK